MTKQDFILSVGQDYKAARDKESMVYLNASFMEAEFEGDFRDIVFFYCDLRYINALTGQMEFENVEFHFCDLSYADFFGINFSNCSFIGCNMNKLQMTNSLLWACSFESCNMQKTEFDGVVDIGSNWRANLMQSNFLEGVESDGNYDYSQVLIDDEAMYRAHMRMMYDAMDDDERYPDLIPNWGGIMDGYQPEEE